MPTALPDRWGDRRLTLRQTVAFLVLLGRMRLLDRRMNRLSQDQGRAEDQARLLAGARAWLALSARIAIVTGIPEPPHARELRAIFAEVPHAETRDGGLPRIR